jgi:GT2 family glycosyltransferase
LTNGKGIESVIAPAVPTSTIRVSDQRACVVAVPARNEAEQITRCLEALVRQDSKQHLAVLALVNNSTDRSASICRRIAATSSVPIRVEDIDLPERDANAGGARRLAMAMAADMARNDGIVLTTDADGRVAPDWLRNNLRAIDHGADAVAGRAVIDPNEEARIPKALRDADAAETTYAALLDQIAARLDPDPADPLPRHDEHSGASIAVTVAAFRAVGGMPDLPVGEDRAFFRRLRQIDAGIRHAPEVEVVVSARTEGRAVGGMADTIRRRLVCPDLFLDDRLEPAQRVAARARLRRRARLAWAGGAMSPRHVLRLAAEFGVAVDMVERACRSPTAGACWHALEAGSPRLVKRNVPVADVGRETARARAILAAIDRRLVTEADRFIRVDAPSYALMTSSR